MKLIIKFFPAVILLMVFQSCFRYAAPVEKYPYFYGQAEYPVEDVKNLPVELQLANSFNKLHLIILDSIKYRQRSHLFFSDIKVKYSKIQKKLIEDLKLQYQVYIDSKEPYKIFYYSKGQIFDDITESNEYKMANENLELLKEIEDLNTGDIEVQIYRNEDSLMRINEDIYEIRINSSELESSIENDKKHLSEQRATLEFLSKRASTIKSTISKYSINSVLLSLMFMSKDDSNIDDPFLDFYKRQTKRGSLIDIKGKSYNNSATDKNGYSLVHPMVEQKLDLLDNYLSNPELLSSSNFTDKEKENIRSWMTGHSNSMQLASATRNPYHQMSAKKNNPAAGSPLNSLHTFGGAVDLSSNGNGNYAYSHRKNWSTLKDDYTEYKLFRRIAEECGFHFIAEIPNEFSSNTEKTHFRKEGLHLVPTEFRNDNYELTPLALRLLNHTIQEVGDISNEQKVKLKEQKNKSTERMRQLVAKNKKLIEQVNTRGELLKKVEATFSVLNDSYVLSKEQIRESERSVLNQRNYVREMEKKLEDVRQQYFAKKLEIERRKNQQEIDRMKNSIENERRKNQQELENMIRQFNSYKQNINNDVNNLKSEINRLKQLNNSMQNSINNLQRQIREARNSVPPHSHPHSHGSGLG